VSIALGDQRHVMSDFLEEITLMLLIDLVRIVRHVTLTY